MTMHSRFQARSPRSPRRLSPPETPITFDKYLSIYIPRVTTEWAKKEKMIPVLKANIGVVKSLDFVCKKENYFQVFVHMSYWYDTPVTRNIQSRMLTPSHAARLVFEPPWFWMLLPHAKSRLATRTPSPQPTPSPTSEKIFSFKRTKISVHSPAGSNYNSEVRHAEGKSNGPTNITSKVSKKLRKRSQYSTSGKGSKGEYSNTNLYREQSRKPLEWNFQDWINKHGTNFDSLVDPSVAAGTTSTSTKPLQRTVRFTDPVEERPRPKSPAAAPEDVTAAGRSVAEMMIPESSIGANYMDVVTETPYWELNDFIHLALQFLFLLMCAYCALKMPTFSVTVFFGAVFVFSMNYNFSDAFGHLLVTRTLSG